MPVGVAVFFLIIGLLLGSVFTFGMKFWNAPIEREDTIYVEATFEEIKIWGGRNGTKGGIVRFIDHDQLYIDSSCLSNELINDLKKLHTGSIITLLVHPNSNTILEMKSEGRVLLKFQDSTELLDSTSNLFVILGIFTYFCAALGAGSLFIRYIKASKQKKQG